MSKFKVIEVGQKIQEGKIEKGVETGMSTLNSLAALGSALGIKTQSIYTMTGMMGNVKNIMKDVKTLWNIKKETKGLDNTTLSVVDIIKNKKLYEDIANYVKSAISLEIPKEPTTTTSPDDNPLSNEEFINQLKKKGWNDEQIAKWKKTQNILDYINKSTKILKEALYLKTPKNEWINTNEFFQSLQNIKSASSELGDNIVKATKLTKEQLASIIDKTLQTFVKNFGYDKLISLATNNPNNFSNLFFEEFKKFLNTLSSSKNEDNYYSQFGNNSTYMKDSDDKIWNNSMNYKEKQDWARIWLGLKPTASISAEAANKLYIFRYQMMKSAKSEIDENDLNIILSNLGIKTKPK